MTSYFFSYTEKIYIFWDYVTHKSNIYMITIAQRKKGE